jgi:hypothetical protein
MERGTSRSATCVTVIVSVCFCVRSPRLNRSTRCLSNQYHLDLCPFPSPLHVGTYQPTNQPTNHSFPHPPTTNADDQAQQELEKLKKDYDQLHATLQATGDARDREEGKRRAAQAELATAKGELERAEAVVVALEGEKRELQERVEGLEELRRQEAAQQQVQQQQQQQQARRESSVLSLGSAAGVGAAPSREELERMRVELQTYRNMVRSQEQGFSLVYVKEVNHPKRYLVVGNGTNLDVSLAGWTLQARSNPEVSFDLPDDAGLSAHGTLLVWWGDGAEARQYKARPNARNYFWEERWDAWLGLGKGGGLLYSFWFVWGVEERLVGEDSLLFTTFSHTHTTTTYTPTPTHSDAIEIFRGGPEGDEVVLVDPEGREMSHLKVIPNAHRRLREPGAGSPSPDSKRHRSSMVGGGGARTPTPYRL